MLRRALFKKNGAPAAKRFVLCRPEGGLNDMLCQIEAAYAYAKTSGRIVVIDTDYANARVFHDAFSLYFSSRDKDMLLDTAMLGQSMENMSVVPRFLSGRANAYGLIWNDEIANWADSETNSALTFDFEHQYDETLLIHHACGGGEASLNVLAKLRLRDEIVDRLAERIMSIGRSFSAIHIRNTDYTTDYRPPLRALKDAILLPVFIATDNIECRNYCVDLFGAEATKYFGALPEEAGTPLHTGCIPTPDFGRNVEAILDLMTLALSTDFFKIALDANPHNATYSGFSVLAENLKNSPKILSSLLGSSASARSIKKRVSQWQSRRLGYFW